MNNLPKVTARKSLGVLVAQSCPTLCNPWTVACQAPLSMEFSRQEYWSGLLLPSPGDLPDPGIEPWSPTLQADSLLSESPRPVVKNPPRRLRKRGSIPGTGQSPGGGNGNPLQYSCLGNSKDRGAGWSPVPGGCKESDMTEHAHTTI